MVGEEVLLQLRAGAVEEEGEAFPLTEEEEGEEQELGEEAEVELQ